jgi:hypothetical protein
MNDEERAILEAENADLKDRLKTLDEDDYIVIRARAQKAEVKMSALEADNARLKKIIDIENLRAEAAEEKAARLEKRVKALIPAAKNGIEKYVEWGHDSKTENCDLCKIVRDAVAALKGADE